MRTQKEFDLINEIKNHFSSLGKDITASLVEAFASLVKTLQASQDERFVFLLVGRTGVGKSSVINALMAQEVAKVNPYEPETMMVESYDSEIDDIRFTVIDTPGLCDDIEDAGNDRRYLELIRSKVKRVDVMWFVSLLNDTRVRADEKRGIELISKSFGSDIWEHSVIIFTFADKVDAIDYPVTLQKRTELIRKEIAKYVGYEVANNIPSVAVGNNSEITPDGQTWLAKLYTKVFVRMSEKGTIPFLLATARRINNGGENASSISRNTERVNDDKTNSNSYQNTRKPNAYRLFSKVSKEKRNSRGYASNREDQYYKSYNETSYETCKQPNKADSSDNNGFNVRVEPVFEFNQHQREEIKDKMFKVAPILKSIGGAIGSIFGGFGKKIGQIAGGAVGHAVDFIGSLFGWF